MTIRSLTAIIVVCSLSGCGSIGNLMYDRTPFGGVSQEMSYLFGDGGEPFDLVIGSATVVDLPLTLVVDTASLPFTVSESIRKEIQRRERVRNQPKLQKYGVQWASQNGLEPQPVGIVPIKAEEELPAPSDASGIQAYQQGG